MIQPAQEVKQWHGPKIQSAVMTSDLRETHHSPACVCCKANIGLLSTHCCLLAAARRHSDMRWRINQQGAFCTEAVSSTTLGFQQGRNIWGQRLPGKTTDPLCKVCAESLVIQWIQPVDAVFTPVWEAAEAGEQGERERSVKTQSLSSGSHTHHAKKKKKSKNTHIHTLSSFKRPPSLLLTSSCWQGLKHPMSCVLLWSSHHKAWQRVCESSAERRFCYTFIQEKWTCWTKHTHTHVHTSCSGRRRKKIHTTCCAVPSFFSWHSLARFLLFRSSVSAPCVRASLFLGCSRLEERTVLSVCVSVGA